MIKEGPMKDWSSFSEFQFMYKHHINSCFQPINSYEKIIKMMSKQVNIKKQAFQMTFHPFGRVIFMSVRFKLPGNPERVAWRWL